MKVLCFGSLNIDYVYEVDEFVRAGETIASRSLSVFGGGKGLNQSIALSRAGAKVYHAGCIGEDGLFLKELLQKEGVDTRFVRVTDRIRSGNAIIQNDRSGDNCIILYEGANGAVEAPFVDEVLAAFSEGDWMLLQNEISSLSYIVESARKKGMKIILNPSPMDGAVKALPLADIDVFLLNETEGAGLCDLFGGGEEEALVGELKTRFPRSEVVLTLGKAGSIYMGGGRIVRQRAYPVQTVDTTAAGDTFTGYYLAGRLRGRSVEEALDLAARAAAAAVTVKGAANSIPRYETLLSAEI